MVHQEQVDQRFLPHTLHGYLDLHPNTEPLQPGIPQPQKPRPTPELSQRLTKLIELTSNLPPEIVRLYPRQGTGT